MKNKPLTKTWFWIDRYMSQNHVCDAFLSFTSNRDASLKGIKYC